MTQGEFVLGLIGNIMAAGVGYLMGKARRRAVDEEAWKAKTFIETVNISLNIIETAAHGQRTLRIRTLVEEPIIKMFPSTALVKRIRDATMLATMANPVLQFQVDRWHICNELINTISKHMPDGYVRQALGKDVISKAFIFGLVYECSDTLRTRRIRCMLIEEAFLRDGILEEVRQYEEAQHELRVSTLMAIRSAVKDQDRVSAVGQIYLAD